MGISSIKSISPVSLLGLWHMTETWQQLQAMLDLPQQEADTLDSIQKDKRKQEWLACRALLAAMTGSAPSIVYDNNRKPHIDGSQMQLSMSHSGAYACVYVHHSRPVGVDIQQMKPSISKGADYFLNEDEQHWADLTDNLLLHLMWSAKESVFKYAANKDLDLKKHILINRFSSNQNGFFEVNLISGQSPQPLRIAYDTFDDYVLTWTVS
ncbi:4'-phosphopantetheinyl transferase family protein [Dyadobacter sp. MSC1_007]|jgi:4'-phosphopantetheinyl transferase|uniref:4'-phosphopantetheinyl transferase family protein n=1 Tax=Dyadobacter sp. MSC1_007 TaxID=2909264 RepID=UPI00202F23AF|nr:4'-phosphopantetheinyl transferase family protein [Dyadobacter sp. MSC1_007]